MKVFLPILFFFTLIACKNDPKKEEVDTSTPINNQEEIVDSLKVSDKNLETQQQTLIIKRKELLEKKDSKEELEKLLISTNTSANITWMPKELKNRFWKKSGSATP